MRELRFSKLSCKNEYMAMLRFDGNKYITSIWSSADCIETNVASCDDETLGDANKCGIGMDDFLLDETVRAFINAE